MSRSLIKQSYSYAYIYNEYNIIQIDCVGEFV